MLPSIEWAEKEYSGKLKVVKVEADANKELVEKYKASSGFDSQSVSTVVQFRDWSRRS